MALWIKISIYDVLSVLRKKVNYDVLSQDCVIQLNNGIHTHFMWIVSYKNNSYPNKGGEVIIKENWKNLWASIVLERECYIMFGLLKIEQASYPKVGIYKSSELTEMI